MSKRNTSVAALNTAKNTVSARVVNLIAKSSWDIEDLITRKTVAGIKIPGIDDKLMANIMYARLVYKTELPTQQVTVDHIVDVRASLSNQTTADLLNSPDTWKWFREVHKQFMLTDKLDHQIADIFSTFKGEEILSKRIGQIHTRMPKYAYIGEFNEYNLAQAYQALALTIFNGLIHVGAIKGGEKDTPWINAKGERKIRTERLVTFEGKESKTRDQYRGVQTEPGAVLSKVVKGKLKERVCKLNKAMKDSLKANNSLPLQLVEVDKAEFYELANEAIKDSENFVSAEVKVFIEEAYQVYLGMLGSEIYLSMRYDYRFRQYYDFVNVVFSPHTKGGKYLFEACTPDLPRKHGKNLQISSAVTLATGVRHNIPEGVKAWKTNQAELTAKLLSHQEEKDGEMVNKKIGERIYQRRLVQAIEDTENGIPTNFLLAQDHTNGGLQWFAAEFASEKSSLLGNISSHVHYRDSHQEAADSFKLGRKEYKDNISQGILHGGASASMAKTLLKITGLSYTVDEIDQFLIHTFGDEIVNIQNYNKFATTLYDNWNTSLYFKTMDNFNARSTAYIEHDKHKVYGLDPAKLGKYGSITITCTMPLVLTNTKSEVIYSSADQERKAGERRNANTKRYGTYANVTHSIDGWSLRTTVAALYAAGFAGVNAHDMYIYQANAYEDVINPQLVKNLKRVRQERPYTNALVQMNNKRVGGPVKGMPEFIYGTATTEELDKATCFLSA